MLSPEMMASLAQRLLSDEMKARLQHFHFEDVGHGFDAFGMHPSAIHLGIGLFASIYESYFRVISKGAEKIPEFGSAILAANHSGNIPIDAMMLWNDVLRQTDPQEWQEESQITLCRLFHSLNLVCSSWYGGWLKWECTLFTGLGRIVDDLSRRGAGNH